MSFSVIALTARAKTYAKRITELKPPTLLAMPGCGPLTAAKLVGESAGASRFHSEAAFARHAGVVPIPVWSGNTAGRVRMTRSGNRQLNAALHGIATTQVRLEGSLGKAYYEKKKKAEGMSNPGSPALPQTTPRARGPPPPGHRPSNDRD